MRHGVYAPARTERAARAQRRRWLQRHGTTIGRLTGPQAAYLDAWARLQAKIEQIDRHLAEVGLLREDGQPQPVLALYTSIHNSARLAMQRLESSLMSADQFGDDPLAQVLADGRAIRVAREANGAH